jgi:hypothetical protein
MGVWLNSRLGAEPSLWLDDTAYCGRLLAEDRIPWLDLTRFLSWRTRASALLKSSVVSLDVGELARAYRAQYLPTATFAELLAAGDLRQHMAELLNALRRSFTEPLAIVIPSPRSWPTLTVRGVDEAVPSGEEETDDASVLIADFLLNFRACGVDLLLMKDDPTNRACTASEIDWYRPVINVARHYRWAVGLKTPSAPPGDVSVDFLIAPAGARGVEVEAEFWLTEIAASKIPADGFRYATVPSALAPERALTRLAELRRR